MCNFTPYRFPGCNCHTVTTGALVLCVRASRTGERCENTERAQVQDHEGICGLCVGGPLAKGGLQRKATASKDKVKAGLGTGVKPKAAKAAKATEEVPMTAAEAGEQTEAEVGRSTSKTRGKNASRGRGKGQGRGRGRGRSKGDSKPLPRR